MNRIVREIYRAAKHIQYTAVDMLTAQRAKVVIHHLRILALQLFDCLVSQIHEVLRKALADAGDNLQRGSRSGIAGILCS